jgi:tripartite-type tricarboxylate transporter receptor subunit TctC
MNDESSGNGDGPRRRELMAAIAGLAAGSYLPDAFAQSAYPGKPVRVVVPYPPGGPTDIVGRIVSQALAEHFKQAFVVENRAGASGMIGADIVAKAPADGLTILMNVSGQVANPALYTKMPHDPFKDFKPVTRLASTPIQLVVSGNSPVKSVKDLIGLVKSEPGRHTFASSSIGTPGDLMGELFKSLVKLDAVHVPYKGSAPALTDVVGGQVTFMFDSMPSSISMVKAGRLRALGVSSGKRVSALPDVPTFAEQGFPDLNLTTWYGLWVPAQTSDQVVSELYAGVKQVLADPAVRTRLLDNFAEPGGESPKEFDAFSRTEGQRYATIIRNANIKME